LITPSIFLGYFLAGGVSLHVVHRPSKYNQEITGLNLRPHTIL